MTLQSSAIAAAALLAASVVGPAAVRAQDYYYPSSLDVVRNEALRQQHFTTQMLWGNVLPSYPPVVGAYPIYGFATSGYPAYPPVYGGSYAAYPPAYAPVPSFSYSAPGYYSHFGPVYSYQGW